MKSNRCYSCNSDKGSCTDLDYGESTLDCPALKGCRIAKTLDSESPQWVRSSLLTSFNLSFCFASEVRGCSLEEEIGCEESTGEDGGVSKSNI